MLKDLKELSDGEIKVAISTVNMTLEVRVEIVFCLFVRLVGWLVGWGFFGNDRFYRTAVWATGIQLSTA